jgi:hypothetical protein
MAVLRAMACAGLHRWLLPVLHHQGCKVTSDPPLPDVSRHHTGVLLGSPEHRVRRAIASYQTAHGWEVAKIAFGEEGAKVLEKEARILEELGQLTAGVPRLLGLHRGDGLTVLRMPYLTGTPVSPDESDEALDLLDRWITDLPLAPVTSFPEWPAIKSALGQVEHRGRVLKELARQELRPVICHGDFARWNLLKQADGKLLVLDWEWGHSHGMPGIDLVHYFLQDARLVERLAPVDAIAKTCGLLNSPGCAAYLHKAGWSGNALLPIIASLAWKQGAGHQENAEVLEAAVSVFQ